jgi:hypothetical protein
VVHGIEPWLYSAGGVHPLGTRIQRCKSRCRNHEPSTINSGFRDHAIASLGERVLLLTVEPPTIAGPVQVFMPVTP